MTTATISSGYNSGLVLLQGLSRLGLENQWIQSSACVKGAMVNSETCMLASPRLGLTSVSSLVHGLFFVSSLLTHFCLVTLISVLLT